MFSKMLFLILILLIKIVCSSDNSHGTFMYYAYGSNLLGKRLHINNPSAVFYSIAKLEDYRLDFNIYADLWHGAVATIVEDPGQTVWGDLWIINTNDMENLDRQEGVDEDFYFAKNVTVKLPNGTSVVARTYEEVLKPSKLAPGEEFPVERRPSNTYLQVIVIGAVESNLPPEYIRFLNSFPTNGKVASEEILNQLRSLGYNETDIANKI